MVFAHFTTIAHKLKARDDWRNDEAMAGGDAFFEEGIHWLHLANSLGPRIVEAHGYRPPASPDGPDRRAKSMLVAFTYDNGAVGSLYYSREIPSLFRGLRLSKLFWPEAGDHVRIKRPLLVVRGDGLPRLLISRLQRHPRLPVRCTAISSRSIRQGRQPEMSLETRDGRPSPDGSDLFEPTHPDPGSRSRPTCESSLRRHHHRQRSGRRHAGARALGNRRPDSHSRTGRLHPAGRGELEPGGGLEAPALPHQRALG